MKCEKIMNGWDVTVYQPNDYQKPVEEREVLLSQKYKTIKQAHQAIQATLEPFDLKIAYATLRKMCDGSYGAQNSQLGQSISINKCKIKVDYHKIVMTKIEIKN